MKKNDEKTKKRVCLGLLTHPLIISANLSPCKGKSFQYQAINKAFALTGRLANCYYTQGVALG